MAVAAAMGEWLLTVDEDNKKKDTNCVKHVVEFLASGNITKPSQLAGASFADLGSPDELKPDQRVFVRRMIAAATAEFSQPLMSVNPAMQALGGAPPRVPTFRVAPKLAAVTLDGLPGHLLPPTQSVVDQLAKDGREQKVAKPFPFAELRKFLPPWALAGTPVEEDGPKKSDVAAALAKALGLPTRPKDPPLTVAQFVAGYTRWARFAVAAGPIIPVMSSVRAVPIVIALAPAILRTGHMTYVQQAQHFDNVMEVAHALKKRSLPITVAWAYDEAERKEWSEKAAREDREFDLDKLTSKVNKERIASISVLLSARLHQSAWHDNTCRGVLIAPSSRDPARPRAGLGDPICVLGMMTSVS